MISLEDVAKLVIEGRGTKVPIACQMLIDAGEAPLNIINGGLIAGMTEVGLRFKADEMFVPEVLASAEAMKAGVEYVMPLINKDDLETLGTVLLGTVKGDLHDIGKNLVGMMLEGAGFTVINAGINVAPEDFVAQIKEYKPDIVAMSALLTTTMLHMKDLVELLREEGLRDSVKVIVGGAPISQDFADGFAPDAVSATDLCKKLLSVA